MAELSVDLDRLAVHLRSKIESEGLSIRTAAKLIGFGASTLSRLLQGNSNANVPDLASINKAAAWVEKSLLDVSNTHRAKSSTIADVEVHLRALPGLAQPDVDALVAMVKAGYERAKKLRAEKGSQRQRGSAP
jgi:transcriptional regulator with XRE-family HTH domain